MPPPPIDKLAIAKAAAVKQVQQQLAKRLGIDPADLTPDMTKMAKDAVNARFDGVARRAVTGFAARQMNADSMGSVVQDIRDFQDQLATTQLDGALKSNAEMMFKTYKSFLDAGFADTQAFQIVLSQVQR